MTIVNDLALAVRGMNLVFVVVSTPHDKLYDGSGPTCHLTPKDFDYTALRKALSDVASVAIAGQSIVIVSTVLPGTMRRDLAPLLPGIRVFYSPSFVAQGAVETDFFQGDLQLIGADLGTAEECALLVRFWKSFGLGVEPVVATWEWSSPTDLVHRYS